MKQTIIKIVLTLAILFLAYLVVNSIREPVQFRKEKEKREKVLINRLKDIRQAEVLYKSMNKKYMGSWDTLIDFLKKAEIPIVKIMPDPEDTTFTKTINDTIGYVSASDSLIKGRIDVEDIKYIPYSDGEIFQLDAGEISKGQVKVDVFEVKARYKQFLKGLDKQLVINLVAEKKQTDQYPGLKVGSMNEPSTDGNWEL